MITVEDWAVLSDINAVRISYRTKNVLFNCYYADLDQIYEFSRNNDYSSPTKMLEAFVAMKLGIKPKRYKWVRFYES